MPKKFLIFLTLFVFLGIFETVHGQQQVSSPTYFWMEKTGECAIGLRWQYASSSGQIDGFRLQYATTSSPGNPWLNQGNINEIPPSNLPPYNQSTTTYSFNHEGLSPPLYYYYYYRIRSVSGSNSSPHNYVSTSSNPPQFQSTGPGGYIQIVNLTPPAAPINLVATGTSAAYPNDRIDLNWSVSMPPTSNGGFEIAYATSSDGVAPSNPAAWTVIRDNLAPTIRDFNHGPGLDNSYVYHYKLRSFEGGGSSGCPQKVYSAPVSVTIPSPPTNLRAQYHFESQLPGYIQISWTPGAGQGFAKIFRATSSQVWREMVIDNNYFSCQLISTPNTCIDRRNLEANETYFYRVMSCRVEGDTNRGCSGYPSPARATVASAPQNFEARIYYASATACEGGCANIYLKWDNTFAGVEPNYFVERTSSRGEVATSDPISSVGEPPIIEYYDYGVPFGRSYTYRVRAEDWSHPSLPQNVDLNIKKILHGQAWAVATGTTAGLRRHGVGWIHFNSETLPSYSVQIDKTGLMSGVAWVSVSSTAGYGWLSFNTNDLRGCPNPPCEARLSQTNPKRLTGWARFLVATTSPPGWTGGDWVSLRNLTGESPSPQTGRLDYSSFANLLRSGFNFLKNTFRSFAQTVVTYDITYDDNPESATYRHFLGEAWGGDIVGWILFTNSPRSTVNCGQTTPCPVYAEIVTHSPRVTNVGVGTDPNPWCADDPFYRVTWHYSDPDGDPPANLIGIQITQERTGGRISTYVTSTANVSYAIDPQNSGEANGVFHLRNILNILYPNATTTVNINVFDGTKWSGTSTLVRPENTTTTPTHYLPFVDFTWSPTTTAPGVPMTFSDLSVSRSGPPYCTMGCQPAPLVSWHWLFPNGNPPTANTSTTQVVFSNLPSDVTLTVGDSSLGSCSFTKRVTSTVQSVPLRRNIFRER